MQTAEEAIEMKIKLDLNAVASLSFFAFLFTSRAAYSQQKKIEKRQGTISFITPQNIYVGFKNTDGISDGDTLFLQTDGRLIPAALVKYRSAMSCAGPQLGDLNLKTGDKIVAFAKVETIQKSAESTLSPVTSDTAFVHSGALLQPVVANTPLIVTPSQNIYGGLSANSYSNFSNYSNATNFERWFYTLNLNADRLGGSRFYFTNFMNFTYLANQWRGIISNPFNDLMVYDLAFGYKTNEFQAWVGRRINEDVPDLGSVDGVQAEAKLGNLLSIGGIVGTRPDFYTMNYDSHLLEFGGCLTRRDTLSNGFMSNTFGVFQQDNSGRIDRRFLYLRHTSYWFNSLSFYISADADLYKLQNGIPMNTISLTSLFLSSTYTPMSLVSLDLTFSALRNIIYYQTFSTTVDSFLLSQNQLRQNVTATISLRPAIYTYISFMGSYSFQVGDILPTRDAGISISQSQIPFLQISLTATYEKILSNYVSGAEYGLTFNKYIPFNSSSVSVGFTRNDYTYGNTPGSQFQDMVMAQGSTRIVNNLFFNMFYQGTFASTTTYSSIMGGLNLRF